jgi:hypothetical protein
MDPRAAKTIGMRFALPQSLLTQFLNLQREFDRLIPQLGIFGY